MIISNKYYHLRSHLIYQYFNYLIISGFLVAFQKFSLFHQYQI